MPRSTCGICRAARLCKPSKGTGVSNFHLLAAGLALIMRSDAVLAVAVGVFGAL